MLIGSDLIYCKTDAIGVKNVTENYLSATGVFVIVLPKPKHRYGTEYLVPILQDNGFEVYSKCIAYSQCTSTEIYCNETSKELQKQWISMSDKMRHKNDDVSSIDNDNSNSSNDNGSSINSNNNAYNNDSNDKIDSSDDKKKDRKNDLFSVFINSLLVDDDYLVKDLDEHEFIAWNLIIGRRIIV